MDIIPYGENNHIRNNEWQLFCRFDEQNFTYKVLSMKRTIIYTLFLLSFVCQQANATHIVQINMIPH